MQPEAGRSGRNRDWVQYDHGFLRVDRGPGRRFTPADPPALKLLNVTGGQTRSSGASHFRAGAVKKKDTAGESLGGRVEELTQGAENDGQWTSLANQSADRPTDFGGAGPHPGCGSLFCGAISGF